MQSGPSRAHGGSCRWQDSIRDTVLGRCQTADGVKTPCASTLESCPEDDRTKWVGPDPTCTVENNFFGRCDSGMCAWSHDHCPTDNTWDAFDGGCTCDRVQVGACSRWKDGGKEREVFCAVSELACDDEQTWITPQEVETAAGFDCFLCREVSVVAPPPETDLGTAVTEGSETMTIGTARSETNNSGINNNGTIIVVCATLGAVVASSIIGLVAWRIFKTRRAAKRAFDGGFGTEAPPTIAIEMCTDEHDDTDKASVLSME